MRVKAIVTCNLQSHQGTHIIELPPSGLIRFQGENNDGKSVIPKATYEMISVGVTDPKVRKALINYNESYAYLQYIREDNAKLTMYLTHASSGCYYELERADGTKVRRTFLEKQQSDLVKEFGFHYDAKRNFSLNVYQTYGPLLLINTGGPTSYDVIQCAITDENATTAIENIDSVQKELRTARDATVRELELSNAELARLVFHDEEEEKAKYVKLRELKGDIDIIKDIPRTEDFQPLVDTTDLEILASLDSILEDDSKHFASIQDEKLTDLEHLFVLTKLTDLSAEILEIIRIYKALEDNVCPTCERSFAGDFTHNH